MYIQTVITFCVPLNSRITMRPSLFLLTGIPITFAWSTALNESHIHNASQSYNISGCSNALYDGFNIVMCRFWDKAVVTWPPEYLKTRSISKPYVARCYQKPPRRNLSAVVCDYGEVKVIHWSHESLQSRSEFSDHFLSAMIMESQEPTHATPEEVTDKLIFKTPLNDFVTSREKRDPSDLIWESDGCTHAPDNPMGFPFLPACQRHDFGYRNYRAQNRLNKATKKQIDSQFKTE